MYYNFQPKVSQAVWNYSVDFSNFQENKQERIRNIQVKYLHIYWNCTALSKFSISKFSKCKGCFKYIFMKEAHQFDKNNSPYRQWNRI